MTNPTKEVTIDRISRSGNPLVKEKHDDKYIRVFGAEPGDSVEVELAKESNNFVDGKIIDATKEQKERAKEQKKNGTPEQRKRWAKRKEKIKKKRKEERKRIKEKRNEKGSRKQHHRSPERDKENKTLPVEERKPSKNHLLKGKK